MVGQRIHGDMTADKVPALLEHYTNLARKEGEAPAQEGMEEG